MPVINIGDAIFLQSGTGEPFGSLSIRERRYGAWSGSFAPAPGYARVRHLFVEWTRLVNEQSFTLVDPIDDKISAIGISAFRDGELLHIHDLQIYDEGDHIQACFRLVAEQTGCPEPRDSVSVPCQASLARGR